MTVHQLRPLLTIKALDDAKAADDYEPALSLPLPENPTLEFLDKARNAVMEYLDCVISDLFLSVRDPADIATDINRAADRLIEIALSAHEALLLRRLDRIAPPPDQDEYWRAEVHADQQQPPNITVVPIKPGP